MAGSLTQEDIQELLDERVLITQTASGKRTVSAALLSPPSSVGSVGSSSSGSSTASVRLRGFAPNLGGTLQLPLDPVSADALEFIGFKMETANNMISRFTSRPDPTVNPDDLLDYIEGEIKSRDPRSEVTLNDAAARVGVQQELVNKLANERFAAIRGTETLRFWVKDTLRINYLTLLSLQARLKTAATTSRAKKKQKRGSIGDAFPGAGAPSSPPAATTQVVTVSNKPKDYNLPEAHIAIEAAGPILPDHVVLYKRRASSEMGEDWLNDDGSINIGSFSTYAGGDFNAIGVAWYWTPEQETAEMYRQWAANRCSYSETWLIRIQIPKTFFDAMRIKQLFYSPDWKEYVFYCRKGMTPPPKYDALWRSGQAELIKGHINKLTPTIASRMKKEELQTKMNDDSVMRISDGVKATQWVIMQIEAAERMAKEMRGKMHIELHAATQSTK